MSKPTLIKGFSQSESDAAVAVLEKSKVKYRRVFSSPAYQSPILITDNNSFSYKGVASIKGYCDSLSAKNK